MWPWRRKDAASPATPPVRRGDWRTLPPIQRIVPEHPLANPVQRFADSLTSWRDPSYLAPLAHQVGPDEPAGVIADYARPAPVDLPVARPPRPGPRAAGGVWSRLRDVVAQRSAAPDSTLPDVEPESSAPDEPVMPEPVVHEALATPVPAAAELPVAAPEPVPSEEPVAATPEHPTPEHPAVEHLTLEAATTGDSELPAEPVRQAEVLGQTTPAVPHRVEAARAASSTPQVQRTVAPLDRSTPPVPVVPPSSKVNRVAESPAPQPLVQRQTADVVVREPPMAEVVAEPESRPDEHAVATSPAPSTPPTPLARQQVHPVPAVVERTSADGSTPVVADARTVESRVSTSVQPVLDSAPVPSVRKDESPTPLVRQVVDFPVPPPVRHEAQRAVIEVEASGAEADARQVVPSPVRPQVSPVAETGRPEVVVARRRGLGAPMWPPPEPSRPLSEPSRPLPVFPPATAAPPPATVQRAPEPVPTPATGPRPEVVRLAHLEPLADHRPAEHRPAEHRLTDHKTTDYRPTVQRLQEVPSAPPVERIELVGARPLFVNRVESGPVDVVRPWVAGAPAVAPSLTRSQPWGESRGAPVAVPPIVSRLIEGAPLAVATSPAVRAPVQRVEQIVRTSTALQREEVQDVPPVPAAPVPASSVPVASGGEPEELATKLYDPLLRRLKAELWLDLERRGALTDVWH